MPDYIGSIHVEEAGRLPITIAETNTFLLTVKGLLKDQELADLKAALALDPLAGDIIPDTGGLRKVRWAAKGRGRRGGARIIYFFHDRGVPIYLLAAYSKSAKVDISAHEKAQMRRLVRELVAEYRSRKLKVVS